MSMGMTTGRVARTLAAVGLLGSAAAAPVAGQLAEAVRTTEDGSVRFEYRTAPEVEVCSNGVRWGENNMRWNWDGDRGGDTCVRGRAGLAMRVRDGRVRAVDVVVPGGDPKRDFEVNAAAKNVS